jgi:hypothetical protein
LVDRHIRRSAGWFRPPGRRPAASPRRVAPGRGVGTEA